MALIGRLRRVGACAGAVLYLSTTALSLSVPPAQLPPPARSAGQPKVRLFQPLNLGLLEAPDRDQWQKPDQIMDALGIADGSVVADLGAGGGWFAVRLARRVGPNGVVYAEDIQPLMIEAIARRAQRESLPNVKPVLGLPHDPRLPSDLDAAIIVDAYHEMDDPPGAAVTLLRSVAASLRPLGRLGVVDFAPGAGGPGPPPDERVNPEAVIAAASAAGFQLQRRETVQPFQFLLVFGKAPAARTSP